MMNRLRTDDHRIATASMIADTRDASRRLVDLLRRVGKRFRLRCAARELLALDDRILDDIGLSRFQLLYEAARMQWRA